MSTQYAHTDTELVSSSSNGLMDRMAARLAPASAETPHAEAHHEAPPTDEATLRKDKELIRKLAACSLFQDYQEAFCETTGLPLALRSAEDWQLAHAGGTNQSAFCALVAQNNQSCASCLKQQQQVCNTANGVPATQKCAFGLNETAVTVKLGERTIGYLQTGQVFFKNPTASQTSGAVSRLQEMGPAVNAQEATAAYRSTRVVRRQTYDSMVRLLEYFAKQLSVLANQILLQQQVAELPQVARARQFIHEHCQEDISLGDVARHAAISPFYLCKKFKETTGLNFTEYLSRLRVEKAKQLLSNPNNRVSEIAFDTGFQSLSHFNRSFKRITGESPTACRAQLLTA